MNSVLSILILVAFCFSPAFAKTKKTAPASTPVSTSVSEASSSDATLFEKSKNTAVEAFDYVKEKSKEAADIAKAKSNESVEKRRSYNYGVNLIYSPIDLIIPGKYGVSFDISSEDKDSQYELQYVRASYALSVMNVDFGKLTDQRFSLLKRNFSDSGNFNWYYGLSYISFQGTIGSSLLSSIAPGNTVPNTDLIDVQSLGLDFGLGHRWYFQNNLSISVDWFGFSQPLAVLKKEAAYLNANSTSQEDKNNVSNTVDFLTSFPRLYTLKVSLGYNF